MSYIPEPGHLIRGASTQLPTHVAVEVLAVVEGAMLLRWTDGQVDCNRYLNNWQRVMPNPDGDGYIAYKSHPIDDRLPDWFTRDGVRMLRAVHSNLCLNIYPDRLSALHRAAADAERWATVTRIARIDPDGTIRICDGKIIVDTIPPEATT